MQWGGNGGSVSKYAPRYFKIDWDIASSDWELVLSVHDTAENLSIIISSSSKLNNNSNVFIINYPMTTEYAKNIIAFSYLPCGVNLPNIDTRLTGIIDFNTLVEILPNLVKILFDLDVNITMEGITEITEDEYYKID